MKSASSTDGGLLPCPLCGGEALGIDHPPHKHVIATFMPDHLGSYSIECVKCSLGLLEPTKQQAVMLWNKRVLGPKTPEVRLNDDKTLDEVVATGANVQLEQMDYNHWFLEIGEVAVWLHAKGKITATYELRHDATSHPTTKE